MEILVSGDYNAFQRGFNCAGVYMASGQYDSRSLANPIYIGSSVDLRRRICHIHIPELQNNCHKNRVFQNSWNKHAGKFVWYLLEECPRERTLHKEQYYLNLYQPFLDVRQGFNRSRDTFCSTKGLHFPPPSLETRIKLSLANKGQRRSEEQRRRISLGQKGKLHSQERNKAQSKRSEKHYTFRNPDGEIVSITGLKAWCEENGLSQGSMCALSHGLRRSYKGWTAIQETNYAV